MRIRPGRRWAWCLVWVLLALPRWAQAGDDPARRWQTLSSPGLRVHYHDPAESLARRIHAEARWALGHLRETLGLIPSQDLEVVLEDVGDDSNGFTRVWPYDHVVLWAAPPGPDSELSVFGNYHRSLVLHELVHVVHMDVVGGAPQVVNRVLGKSLLPNGASPSWWIEGWATFIESRSPNRGRAGGTDFDRILRTAALEGRFLSLSQLTVAPEDPPRGGAFYVYGGAFLSFLERRVGLERLVAFLQDYGRRVVPFAMNTVARRTLGADFEDLYREFQDEVARRAREVRDRRTALGIVAGTVLTRGAESVAWPLYRPDGRGIWYVRSDGHRDPAVIERDLQTGREVLRVPCQGGCGRLALHHGAIATIHQVPHRLYATYGDLFLHDPGHRPRRLTFQARARDLFGDTDGNLWHVTTRNGEVALVRRTPDGTGSTPIPFGTFDDLGAGTVLEDGSVVFPARRDGRWDLWRLDPEARRPPVRLTDDGCRDRNPVALPDGRSLVFVRDAGGIDDLFLLDVPTGQRRRLTRVLGGVRHPAVRPDGHQVAFGTWTSRGWDLAVLDLGGDPGWPEDPDQPDDQCPDLPSEEPPRNPPETPEGPRPYSPWKSVRPRALEPILAWDSGGAFRLGASVHGQDALGHLGWQVGIDVDPVRGRPAFTATLAYDGTWPSLALDVSTWSDRAWAVQDDRWMPFWRREWRIGLRSSLPLPLRDRSFGFAVGWEATFHQPNPRPPPMDPAASPPLWPRDTPEGRFSLGIYHDETAAFAHSVGTSRGHREGLVATIRHPLQRSDGGLAWSVSGSVDGFLPMPWPGDQVLSVQGSGAVAGGDPDRRPRYSLGGTPTQDPWSALWLRQPWTARWLRGYPDAWWVGDAMMLWTVAYQVPLWSIHRGTGTFPLAARRLWATLFCDLGSAWRIGDRPEMGSSLGVEFALSLHLLQWFDGSLRLGYGRGLGPRGGNTFYWLIGP
ncbi:MAG TPA: hypothetical protein PLQ97_00585 [Myxococcota bacterium]|nr:hypothetical protein [Myxococcota bacterium]HQK49669.1 hypothetical protein [Myxococcota bacterium]